MNKSVIENQKDIAIPLVYSEIPVCFFRGTLGVRKSSVETIHLHKYVSGVHYNAFDELNNLRSITVDEKNTMFQSDDGVLYVKGHILLKKYPQNKEDPSFVLPPETQYLEANAFAYCKNIESIKLNGNIDVLPTAVFSHCPNLKEVIIPTSVKEIHKNIIYGDDNLNLFVAGRIEQIFDSSFVGSKATIYCSNSLEVKNMLAHRGWRATPVTVDVRKWDGKGIKIMKGIERTDSSVQDISNTSCSVRKGLEVFRDSVMLLPPFVKIESEPPVYIGKFENNVYYKTTNMQQPFICSISEAYNTILRASRDKVPFQYRKSDFVELRNNYRNLLAENKKRTQDPKRSKKTYTEMEKE